MAPLPSLNTFVDKTVKEVKSTRARGMAKAIATNPVLNDGVQAMMERHTEMRSPLTALLAGIAADPKARRMWDDHLDAMWVRRPMKATYPLVFIGSGLSAATFCATRARHGYSVPLVLEAKDRAGGAFAVSRSASFWLNSRNRPGGLGLPGSDGALNFIPNAPVQPSELGFGEYQDNADMAFAIRAVFAHTGAEVMTETSVSGLSFKSNRAQKRYPEFYVEVRTNAGIFKASQVIVGTGLNQQAAEWYAGERLLSFAEFMRRLDEPFPFRNIGRVAVIGGGDSGKVVIEALTGQGPARHMSVVALDFPSEITWYGQPYTTRAQFEECNRSRYRGLGPLLEGKFFRNQRVRCLASRVENVEEGYDCVLVDGQPFDLVINCAGVRASNYLFGYTVPDLYYWMNSSETDYLGRYVEDENGEPRIFFVGPGAQLPKSDGEARAVPTPTDARRAREQLVAAWRYVGRTAMVARSV